MSTSRDLDKFYTRPQVADQLVERACDALGIDRNDHMFLEPSAGSGAFLGAIPKENMKAYDLMPEGDGIEQADFLTLEPSWDKDTIAIGNPPFGKRARLAIDFINRCAESCDAVCFVLPNTFRRYNTQKALDENLALILDIDLDEHETFTFEGNPYSLRCVFQVWVRKDGAYWNEETMKNLRYDKRPPIAHEDFNCWQHNATVESRAYLNENWKYAFWRQGYKDYGKVFTRADDFDEVKDIMFNTNLQLFLIEPLTDEAEELILSMDRDSLAMQNLSTPGFGKADFVAEYMRMKDAKSEE